MTTGGYANWASTGAGAPDKKIPRPIADPMILAVMPGSSCLTARGPIQPDNCIASPARASTKLYTAKNP